MGLQPSPYKVNTPVVRLSYGRRNLRACFIRRGASHGKASKLFAAAALPAGHFCFGAVDHCDGLGVASDPDDMDSVKGKAGVTLAQSEQFCR